MWPKRSVTAGPDSRVLTVPHPRPEVSVAGTAVGGVAVTDTDGAAPTPPVLAALWCCSVGATWTLELHELDRGAALGTLVDWAPSGIPTSQPEPEEVLASELLAGFGLWLYRDEAVGPCTQMRHGVGYVCGDPEVITLAYGVRDEAAEAGVHPVLLAARRIAARHCGHPYTGDEVV